MAAPNGFGATSPIVVISTMTTIGIDGITSTIYYTSTLSDPSLQTGSPDGGPGAMSTSPDSITNTNSDQAQTTPFPSVSSFSNATSTLEPATSTSGPPTFPGGPAATTSTASPVPTPSAAPSHHGLSKGARAAAIAVPVIVLMALLLFAGLFFFRRRQKLRGQNEKNLPLHRVSVQDISGPMGSVNSSGHLHAVERKSSVIQSAYYTNLSNPSNIDRTAQPDDSRTHLNRIRSPYGSPSPSRHLTSFIASSPEPLPRPDSARLTEVNLKSHRDSHDPRPQSPFANSHEDNISEMSSVHELPRAHERNADEVSIISSMDDHDGAHDANDRSSNNE